MLQETKFLFIFGLMGRKIYNDLKYVAGHISYLTNIVDLSRYADQEAVAAVPVSLAGAPYLASVCTESLCARALRHTAPEQPGTQRQPVCAAGPHATGM